MDRSRHEWQDRVDATWSRIDALAPDAFVTAIDALAAERPDDDAAALFERAAARDSTGVEGDAEHFYRAALATGRLDAYRSVRATLQLASTLRILGHLQESERMLTEEFERRDAMGGTHALHDELRSLLALTWIAQGRPLEAAALALSALAPHLTRYQRSTLAHATNPLREARAASDGGPGSHIGR